MAPVFNLEERTLQFALDVRAWVRFLPLTLRQSEEVRQLLRASGAVGANYIEANEALGKKDFLMRTRIALKEAKECRFWLRLIQVPTEHMSTEQKRLQEEARQLVYIFATIIRNASKSQIEKQ